MADWQGKIAQAAEAVEHQVDKAKRTVKRSLGLRDPLIIDPYIGYANGARVFLQGRVLEGEGVPGNIQVGCFFIARYDAGNGVQSPTHGRLAAGGQTGQVDGGRVLV